jgi:hypothetical protein
MVLFIIDPLGERVDVRYTNESSATFIPRTSGFFKIYISDYHGPILGSPFFINVPEPRDLYLHKKDIKADAIYVESSGIRDTIVNEETKFLIRNKDADIDVQIKGSISFYSF